MFSFRSICSWFASLFGKYYVVCNKTESGVMLSEALFKRIQKDHPNDKQYNVVFTKIKDEHTFNYAMFFNPEYAMHGVENPAMIFSVPLTLGKKGHIGFQSVMPTINEIFAVYGISEEISRVNVSRHFINGEPYYLLNR